MENFEITSAIPGLVSNLTLNDQALLSTINFQVVIMKQDITELTRNGGHVLGNSLVKEDVTNGACSPVY